MKKFQIGFICFLMIFIVSCSSNSKKSSQIIPQNYATSFYELENLMKSLNKKNTFVFAPIHYKKAKKSFLLVKQLLLEEKDQNKINEMVSKAKTDINNALRAQEVSIKLLAPVVIAYNDALKAHASVNDKKFIQAINELKKLSIMIETNQRDKAKENMGSVEKAFRRIEINAIIEYALKGVRALIEANIDYGGEALAPKTLNEAKKALVDVEKFITNDSKNKIKIKRMVNEASFIASRALNITFNAKIIERETPEQTALRVESLLYEISLKLEINDIRDKSFVHQKREINAYIDSLFKAGVLVTRERRGLTKKVSSLKDEVGNLAEKERVRELMNSIQNDFSIEQADVYLKDGRVIIRLTGLNFVSGKSFLIDEHKRLLDRVGRVVKKLGKSFIRIEGHTDSVGDQENNLKLSENRARSVRDYFVQMQFVNEDMIDIVGFGFLRPIVTNKTIDGRKENRRIDLVIRPMEL